MTPAPESTDECSQAIKGVFQTIPLIAVLIMSAVGASIDDAAGAGGSADIAGILDDVSGGRMLATVQDLESFGSRAFYLHSSLEAAGYIRERLADLGLWVEFQYFDVDGYSVPNVIAVKNGTSPSADNYLFGAHYDSANMYAVNYTVGADLSAPGADDDASGVAAVIELATVMRGISLEHTVKFAAFAAEETGLNGSELFASTEKSSGVRYADTVIMDMIGYRAGTQNKVVVFTDHPHEAIAGTLEQVVNRYDIDLAVEVVPSADYAFSDHYPFWEHGYPTTAILEEFVDGWPANPYYHTENDTSDHIFPEQIEAVAKAVLGAFLELEQPELGSGGWTMVIVTVVIVIVIATAVAYVVLDRKGKM